MPTVGLEGGTLAFDMLLHMSAAVPRHSTLLRDTAAQTGQRDTGDPRSARAWLSAPCLGERAVQSLRGCLLAAGVPVPYAQLMTKHSPRHVLTESANGTAAQLPPLRVAPHRRRPRRRPRLKLLALGSLKHLSLGQSPHLSRLSCCAVLCCGCGKQYAGDLPGTAARHFRGHDAATHRGVGCAKG